MPAATASDPSQELLFQPFALGRYTFISEATQVSMQGRGYAWTLGIHTWH
jgi:hypothetical protein